VEFLDLPGGVMLGVAQGDYAVTDTDLPGGSVLALYTDGLIEQPGQPSRPRRHRLPARPNHRPDGRLNRVTGPEGPSTSRIRGGLSIT
jgi:hypothetical protein